MNLYRFFMRCICRFLVATSATVADGVIIMGGPADGHGTGDITHEPHNHSAHQHVSSGTSKWGSLGLDESPPPTHLQTPYKTAVYNVRLFCFLSEYITAA